MKKLLLLPFLALVAVSCSTDTEELENYAQHSAAREMAAQAAAGSQSIACFRDLTAYPSLQTVNGPGTGTLTFISQTPAGLNSGSYKVRVETEELVDCEDLNSANGNVAIYTTGATYTNISANPPQIGGVNPAQTFACYRWRMVFECLGKGGTVLCSTCTPWYDAPLF